MKHKVILVFIVFLIPKVAFSQFVVSAPASETILGAQAATQASILTEAVGTLKALKTANDQYKEIDSKLKEINQLAQTAEDRLTDLGNLKDFKLTNLVDMLDKINCLNDKTFPIPNLRFDWIYNMFLDGLIQCDNDKIYTLTFGGIKDKIYKEYSGYGIGKKRTFRSVETTTNEINQELSKLDNSIAKASDIHQLKAGDVKKFKLELGLKYEIISKELMEVGLELYRLGKCEGCVELTRAERLEILAKGMDYHIKAGDYALKHHEYLADATALTPEDKKVIGSKRKSLLMQKMAAFRN